LFWDMMEQAEIQFGFDASDSQICVEAIPDPEEGFVIIITKLDEDGEFESIHKYIKNRFRKSDLRVRKRNSRVSSSIVIYFFNNLKTCALYARSSGTFTQAKALCTDLKEFITWFLPKIHGQWQI